jgi:hypothetical protein
MLDVMLAVSSVQVGTGRRSKVAVRGAECHWPGLSSVVVRRGVVMSDIAGELARVREAFEKPTLRLLDRKWAPLVLAVFKSSFSRDQRSVPAERLHIQVDTYLDELRSVGEQVPNLQGRASVPAVDERPVAVSHDR